MHFKFGGDTVLAVQIFNKIKRKEKKKKKKTKNLKKYVSLYFPDIMSLYLVNLFFFVCFRHCCH